MLRESWMAWSYHVCGEQALFEHSRTVLEADQAADGIGDPLALVWLRLMQGDIDASMELIRFGVENRTVMLPFILIYSLPTGGLEGMIALGQDQRYIELVKSLNFPEAEY